jgi:D-serine deaminase-like pyridoxal phosphate-dependent protein
VCWGRPVASEARPAELGHDAPVARGQGARTPEQQLARLERATAGLQAPFALVDLDALLANAADMERRAAPKPIRLASKSVRCRALQERILARPGFRGTLAYTLPEALWLASRGGGDLLVAYPTADRDALRTLSAAGAPTAAGAAHGEASSPQ